MVYRETFVLFDIKMDFVNFFEQKYTWSSKSTASTAATAELVRSTAELVSAAHAEVAASAAASASPGGRGSAATAPKRRPLKAHAAESRRLARLKTWRRPSVDILKAGPVKTRSRRRSAPVGALEAIWWTAEAANAAEMGRRTVVAAAATSLLGSFFAAPAAASTIIACKNIVCHNDKKN